MKSLTLTPAEVVRLVEFVEDVRCLVESDDTGILIDLVDNLLVVEEILGIKQEEENLDDDET